MPVGRRGTRAAAKSIAKVSPRAACGGRGPRRCRPARRRHLFHQDHQDHQDRLPRDHRHTIVTPGCCPSRLLKLNNSTRSSHQDPPTRAWFTRTPEDFHHDFSSPGVLVPAPVDRHSFEFGAPVLCGLPAARSFTQSGASAGRRGALLAVAVKVQ
ncbi:hypothetical protein FOCC_FOCC003871 [Frankliniella occidentalis]|nr:hypothetical protein FOCC_FOCC003871 [Frankliniella occidentalis]